MSAAPSPSTPDPAPADGVPQAPAPAAAQGDATPTPTPDLGAARRPGWSLRRWIVLVSLCLAVPIVGSCIILASAYVPPPLMTTLSGDGTAMGTAYGEAHGGLIRALLHDYLRDIVCNGDAAAFQARGELAAATLQVEPALQAELEATAAAAEVPLGALVYGNAFLDQGSATVGCRSIVAQTPGGLLHGHNLDWQNLAGFAKKSVLVLRRNPSDGRLRTVSVGFPGLVGTLDVINEKGVALSFNQLGQGRAAAAEPVFLMMRRVAEHCGTFAEARAALLAASPGMPFLITLSDAKTDESVVLERKRDTIAERLPDSGLVMADNFGVDHAAENDDMFRAVQGVGIRGPYEMQQALRHPKVLMDMNLYSVIFDFKGDTLYLASGRIPAANGPYREFPLFTAP